MSMWDEVELFTKLSGRDGEHTPIGIIGSFLDGYDKGKEDATKWIPCSEGLPKEDHWLGGSGKQFSEIVFVTIVNHNDDDIWTDTAQTIDGEWMLELPRHCEITAWMPLPEPYRWGGDRE